jgi:hypothetical protein
MAIATYTYDALPPAEQAALPPVEAITAAFTSTADRAVQLEGIDAVDDTPEVPQP